MRKRIACITHSLERGGGELAFLEMVRSLEDYDVVVIYPTDGPLREPLLHACEHAYVCDMDWWYLSPMRLKQKIKQLVRMYRQSRRVAKILRQQQIDAVIVNSIACPIGAFAAKMAHIPLVWFMHEIAHPDGYALQYGEAYSKRLVGKLADVVLCNSQYTMEMYAPYIDRNKMMVAYQTVQIEPIAHIDRVEGAPLQIGMVGRLHGQKNHLLVCQALRTIDDISIHIAGFDNTDYGRKVKQWLADNNMADKVVFEGVQTDMAAFYAKMDVVVVAGEKETLGRSVIEAMKCGVPVVAPNDYAFAELIEDGVTGLYYERNDMLSLQMAVQKMKDETVRSQITQEAKMWASSMFNTQNFSTILQETIEAIV